LFAALQPLVEIEGREADDELDEEDPDRPLSLAIVGRPNAGKSTLVNQMLGQDRMITGPEAGITRDSISLNWEWKERPVQLVDTAGLRKRAKVEDKLERLSAADTKRSIDYAEVVVLLLDATRGLEAQDLRIAAQVIEEGRALIIALNKWDVAENASSLFNGVKAALAEGLAQLRDVPLLTVSAKTGKGTDTLLDVAFDLRDAWAKRIPTGELNRWFEDAVEANPPPAPKGQRIKLRYITQVKTRPPTFVVFGNRTDELPESYRRYLLNAMRRDLKLGPVPLRLDFRGRSNPFDKSRR
jgi:GTP-binding protein